MAKTGNYPAAPISEPNWLDSVPFDGTTFGDLQGTLDAANESGKATVILVLGDVVQTGNSELAINPGQKIKLKFSGISDSSVRELDAKALSRVLTVSESAMLFLEGVSLVNGLVENFGKTFRFGGGVLDNGTLVLLANSSILDCSAPIGGWVYSSRNSVVSMQGAWSRIASCTAELDDGGGVYLEDGATFLGIDGQMDHDIAVATIPSCSPTTALKLTLSISPT